MNNPNTPNLDSADLDSGRREINEPNIPGTGLAGDIEKTQDDLYVTVNHPVTTTGPGKN